jgi:hypothetical protein
MPASRYAMMGMVIIRMRARTVQAELVNPHDAAMALLARALRHAIPAAIQALAIQIAPSPIAETGI